MDKIRVVSVYPNFANRGGAQDVVLQLAEKLNPGEKPIVLTYTDLADIVSDYHSQAQFIPFCRKSVRYLADEHTVFLSHHRKNTSMLLLFNLLFGQKIHVVHVAHNTFTNLRQFTFFPKQIVAVSNGVKDNLIEYFRVPESHINVIFNGKPDYRNMRNRKTDTREIRILWPGRICEVKQQVEMVRKTRGKLAPHIHICFAGTGEELSMLKKEIECESQYHYMGFLDMADHLNEYDYVCLFSKKEGQPLSLIEGLMFGKPLITNNLLAVLDANVAKNTGFVFSDLASIVKGLNELPMPDSEEYARLSVNARLRYESLFTEERMIAQYRRVIAQEMER